MVNKQGFGRKRSQTNTRNYADINFTLRDNDAAVLTPFTVTGLLHGPTT
jgi:hypothetical protein